MTEIYLSEASRSSPVVIMQITGADNNVCSLYIGEFDDPSELALQFIDKLGLPDTLKERVEGQIVERREQFFEARRKEQLVEAEACSSKKESLSPAEKAYYNARENWGIEGEDSPFNNMLKKSQSTFISRKAFYSAGNKQNSPLPNQAAFDRMHDDYRRKYQRQEQLRLHYEKERIRSIENTTFRAQGGHMANSPSVQRPRSSSAGRVRSSSSDGMSNGSFVDKFTELYESRKTYQSKKLQREAEVEKHLNNLCYGIPRIAPKSHALAMKRRENRETNQDLHPEYSKNIFGYESKFTPKGVPVYTPRYGSKLNSSSSHFFGHSTNAEYRDESHASPAASPTASSGKTLSKPSRHDNGFDSNIYYASTGTNFNEVDGVTSHASTYFEGSVSANSPSGRQQQSASSPRQQPISDTAPNGSKKYFDTGPEMVSNKGGVEKPVGQNRSNWFSTRW